MNQEKMNQEKSCGAVIYYQESIILYLLIQSKLNTHHWGFVKGHIEPGETEQQTSIREILEEVGLEDLIFLDDFRFVHSYNSSPFTTKEVVIFIAKSVSKEVFLCTKEVMDSLWLPYEEALQKLTYKVDKTLLQEANQKLTISSV